MPPKALIFPAILVSLALAQAEPPEWSGKPDRTIEIKTLLGQMKYNIAEFDVEPGAKIKITLNNEDDLQHNLLVLDQDPKDKDGIQFATDVWMLGEKGIELQWIPPGHKRVLAASSLIDPHGKTDLYVVMPEAPGDYPFVCTVPGHTLTMRGKINVRSNRKLLTGLKYKVYEGSWAKLPDFSSLKPVAEGSLDSQLLDLKVSKKRDNFGVVYQANLEIPKTADYEFELGSDDGSQLIVDGENEILIDGVHPPQFQKKKLKLEEGLHTIEVRYFEGSGGEELYLTLKGGPIGGLISLSAMVRGGGQSQPKAAPTPILVLAENEGEAVIYRNFIEGSNPRGIAVGYPGRVNICWDADVLNVALLWRGGFMDASRHWNGRGQGNQPPAGFDVAKPAAGFPLQVITPETQAWQTEHKGKYLYDRDNPNSKSERQYIEQHPDYQFKGYRLDEKRFPTFNYTYQKLEVQDRYEPKEFEPGIEGMERTVTISGSAAAGTHFRIAENISEGEDGWFAAGGPLRIKADGAEVLAFGQNKQLVVPINGDTTFKVQYSWKTKIGGRVSSN